jgi:DNA topoisomerase-1
MFKIPKKRRRKNMKQKNCKVSLDEVKKWITAQDKNAFKVFAASQMILGKKYY